MRVAVEKITDKEFKAEETIPAVQWDLDSSEIKFIDTIELACTFVRFGKEIVVDAAVVTRMIVTCGRCLDEVPRSESLKFQFTYDSTTLGEFLEMDSDIRQELVLNFPMHVLCQEECKGLCAGCGVNLNHQQCVCARDAGTRKKEQ
ncbi:MAG: DUF177 domain-containing protein [Candidatus Omnitrophota bacterium]